MQVFYSPDIDISPELPDEEARHCVKVLRMVDGDEMMLTDGKGYFYRARLINSSLKHPCVEIVEKIPTPLPWRFRIHIAMAPVKNLERMEWFAEKATEIGINELSLVNCRYSQRKEIKTGRIGKIMVSAMKQSQKAVLPIINEMSPFRQFVKSDLPGQKFIAHCYPDEKPLLKDIYCPESDATVLIGPEGDFSREEVEEAIAEGFQPVSLGNSRLRTETAALVACHSFHVLSRGGC